MSDFIGDAIAAAQLKFEAIETTTDHYACTLSGPHGTMKRTIQMKPGYEPPKLGGVLLYYAGIAQYAGEYEDILDWAKSEDRDPGAPDAIKEFRQMVDDERDLRLALGEPVFKELMSGLAISQAITNAGSS